MTSSYWTDYSLTHDTPIAQVASCETSVVKKRATTWNYNIAFVFLTYACRGTCFTNEVLNELDSERLYLEEIDVGEGAPRAIVSGLKEHLTPEEMEGSLVLVVTNLKPTKLAGAMSNGMVLAAKGRDGKASFWWAHYARALIPSGSRILRVGLV